MRHMELVGDDDVSLLFFGIPIPCTGEEDMSSSHEWEVKDAARIAELEARVAELETTLSAALENFKDYHRRVWSVCKSNGMPVLGPPDGEYLSHNREVYDWLAEVLGEKSPAVDSVGVDRKSEPRPGGGSRATIPGVCGKCGKPEQYEHARTCVWYAKCQLRIDGQPCLRSASNVVPDMGVCMSCLEELGRRGHRDEWGPSQPRHMWLAERCSSEAQRADPIEELGRLVEAAGAVMYLHDRGCAVWDKPPGSACDKDCGRRAHAARAPSPAAPRPNEAPHHPWCEEHSPSRGGNFASCLACECRELSRAISEVDRAIDPRPDPMGGSYYDSVDYNPAGVVDRVQRYVRGDFGLPRPDNPTPEAVNSFAGVDPRSPEAHLRSVLWEILGGMGAESVESAAQRVVRDRDTALLNLGEARRNNELVHFQTLWKDSCRGVYELCDLAGAKPEDMHDLWSLRALILELKQQRPETAENCTLPPPGWSCSRSKGHEGPCAAWPIATGKGQP